MKTILFIELLGGLGDVLIALPAIQALAAAHPQAQMTVLTFAPGDELLRHHPLIYRVLRAQRGQARAAVMAALREAYDLVVTDTTYDGIGELVQQCGARRAIANLWRNPPAEQLVSDRFRQILQAEALISPATATAHRHPRIHLTAAEQAAAQAQLGDIHRPGIGLYPDAGMAIKRWSSKNFVDLGKLLRLRYEAQIWVPEGADREQVEAIATQIPDAVLWPRRSLRELAALFAQLDCVIAADTGPARIAAAVGTPTVTLFGPSWRGRYGQPSPHPNRQGYSPCPERNIADFTEQTCWYSGTCPFAWDTCVNLISPSQVADAVGSVLRKGEGGRVTEWQGGRMAERQSGRVKSSPPAPSTPHPIPNTHSPSPHPPHPSPPSPPARNLLILRLDNIGDVLMTSPALKAIKESHPDTRLTLMASPAGALTAPLLPWVDEVLPWRTRWQAINPAPGDMAQEWELIKTLRSRQFDGAIILTSFKQSPHPPALVCQMAGIPLRVGASRETGECLTHRVADLPDDLHQVERNLQLVEAAGFPVRDRQLSLTIPPSRHLPETPYLLLNPWTSCPSRMYSLERFAIAARTLSAKTGYPVVITGTQQNRCEAAPLIAALGECAIDLIGQTRLSDLVALVAHAQLMLSNNTSTMHIADATQTPSVILFAGTELERQWRPRQTPVRLLRRPTPCAPCYAFTCPYEMECLDLPPAAVVAAGLALLQSQSTVRA